jgi:hypothetical protein
MFAISLTLVVLISATVLLYQYWSGAFAASEGEMPMTDLRPEPRNEVPAPAQAA